MRVPALTLVIPAVAVLSIVVLSYGNAMSDRAGATFDETTVAPNKRYSIDKYFIPSSDSAMLFRVFDRDRRLIGEYVRRNYIGNPIVGNRWECTKDECTEFWWNSGDDDRIALPPSWLDRLRAKLP